MNHNITMSFAEACGFLAAADHILVDNRPFVVRAYNTATALTLVGEDPTSGPPAAITTWFIESDNRRIEVEGGILRMREEHGEEAYLKPVFDSPVKPFGIFKTAETAAALMDAMHGEVCKQSEGSDSAYHELYEAATKVELGFPGIWGWVATMAMAARVEMEGKWERGEADFIECVHVAAQQLHNFITDPREQVAGRDVLTASKCEEMWRESFALIKESEVGQSAWALEQDARRMLEELREAARNNDGYLVGEFTRKSGSEIVYDLYGGPTVVISLQESGRWRVGDDVGTDAPRPVQAFKISRIPVDRG